MSKRVFAVGAHPDDIEFVMCGTLLRLRAIGYEIHYMNLADGCCGSTVLDGDATARTRLAEARAAAEMLGAVFYPPLVKDLEVFYEKTTLARLAAIMREAAPEILLTHSPCDYMEDHQNTSRLAVTAAFCRNIPNFITDPPRAATSQPMAIYHAQPHGNRDQLGQLVKAEFFVDITGVLPQKAAILSCHKSQKEWLDATQGLDSYLHAMHELGREVGRMSGRFEYAEGWRRHLHLGFADAAFDPLAAIAHPAAP